jgi:uncharacterized protein YbjT (DUF2867 family)
MSRQPESLIARTRPATQVVEGDLLDYSAVCRGMEGIDAAYFLVHSMGSSGNFEEKERLAAQNFARAAREAGVSRIIFLGGLGRDDSLSAHLRSRQAVGRILAESGIPTFELRASIIIGSGSLSFEMIRALVDKLPVMVTPRWVRILAQPIAVEDVISYLVETLDVPASAAGVYEIGGTDRVSYGDLMREYARQRGLRRWILPVPVLSLALSSLWLGLVTPIYARVGRKLIESVRHPTVVNDETALQVFSVRPSGIRVAISRALANEDKEYAETRWSDALSSAGEPRPYGGMSFGNRIVDSRTIKVPVSDVRAFDPVGKIGGKNGWYYANWLWALRGFLDMLLGGPGMRRGRRHPSELLPGDSLDFWRVEAIEPNRLLRLRAEMKVPGRAWLQFEISGNREDGTEIRQTAIFDPLGLAGRLYWYVLYPFHALIFRGMLREIGQRAQRSSLVP